MVFKDFVLQELEKNGLFNHQALDVFTLVEKNMSEMRSRWNDDVSGYPPVMKNIVWANVKIVTLKYIETTCPDAWFKPMFETKKEK
jgi:hypothetical protein